MKNRFLRHTLVLLTILGMTISCSDDFTAPPTPSGTNIVDVAKTAGNLDIFAAALEKTNLANSLRNLNSGEYTLFAPNDDAFLTYFKTLAITNVSSWGEAEAIAYIKNDMTASSAPLNIGQLASRLTYHMVSSKIPSSAITTGNAFTTINGARLSASHNGTFYYLNANTSGNGSQIVTADVAAANGTIHVLNKVLTAVSTGNALTFLGYGTTPVAYTTNPPTISGGTSVDGADDYDLFSVALRKTSVCLTVFPNVTPLPDYTIFAPKDVAFRAFLNTKYTLTLADEVAVQTFINGLDETTTPKLSDFTALIKKHIVSGRILTTDLISGSKATIQSGASLNVVVNGTTITLGGTTSTSTLNSKDNLTNAGVIHGIDVPID